MKPKASRAGLVLSSRAVVLKPSYLARFHCKISSIVMQHLYCQFFEVVAVGSGRSVFHLSITLHIFDGVNSTDCIILQYGQCVDEYSIIRSVLVLVLVAIFIFSQHSVQSLSRSTKHIKFIDGDSMQ